MITVYVIGNGDKAKQKWTLDSLEEQKKDWGEKLNIVFPERGRKLCRSIGTDEPDQILLIHEGETMERGALFLGSSYLEQVGNETDAVFLSDEGPAAPEPGSSGSGSKNTVQTPRGRVYSLEKRGDILQLPATLRGVILRREAADDVEMEDFGPGTEEAWICGILNKKRTVGYVKNAVFHGTSPFYGEAAFFPEWLEESWYLDTAENYCLCLLKAWKKTGEIPLFVQAQVFFALKTEFQINKDNKDKEVLKGQRLERYLELCRECLELISDDLITHRETVRRERRLLYGAWSAFMELKYGGKSREERIRLFSRRQSCHDPGSFPFVLLKLMEEENGNWRMDGEIDRFLSEDISFLAKWNGKTIAPVPTCCFATVSFFGMPLVKRMAFSLKLDSGELQERNELGFTAEWGGTEIRLLLLAIDYTARLTKHLENSYWCFGRYMVTLEKRGKEDVGLLIRQAGRGKRIFREIRLLNEILRASYGSKQMFLLRVFYWLVWPLYFRKNIWITFDKLYKGGDCGEYFYKYTENRKQRGILPVYVIRKDVSDYGRLKKEGYHPAVFRSRKQRILYLYAKMVFATHSSVPGFCGFSKWEIRFLQDRLRSVNTCIQHGLSVQDLTYDSNRLVNNNKRYYCASKYEVENLSGPEYDYGKDVLRLTGIPRYDGLVNRDRHQILITPTWRAYIAMPSVMGQARPYNPEFKHTDYFRIFQELLSDRKLRETAAKTGYRLIYLLHPVISSQKEDFQVEDGVEIVSATDVNYEQILTESSLMVTDYSGVQFDFAYMRKPVVYFHPPKLPPHYVEGGFFYDTQGFGEICTEIPALVEVLCDYMEHGCELKEFYRKRQDDFFAFNDRENCRRIFEDALELQKG